MASLIRTSQLLLILTSSVGFYSTWYLSSKNGTVDLMAQIRDHGPHILPGTNAPLKKVYTGIGWIDYQLTVLTLFFWSAVDGSRPNTSLFTFMFAGQATAVWTILTIEGRRYGNRWRLVSLVTVWGLAIQFGAFALFGSIYALVHLATSPLVSSRKADDYEVDTVSTSTFPISLIIGFGLPSVLLALPAPSVLTYDQKQTFIAIWQVFPIWVEALQLVLPFLVSTLLQGTPKTRTSPPRQTMWALRLVYAFALAAAGITRVTTIMLSLTSKLFPALFAPEYRGVLDPSRVFVVESFFPSKKMKSIGEGAGQFLQYDEMTGSAALVIWSIALYLNIALRKSESGSWVALKTVSAFTASIALFGPSGSALCFIWARDELVLVDNEGNDKKSN